MGLESLTFEHKGTKVELKAEVLYRTDDLTYQFFLVPAKITPPGRNPIKTNLRYDAGKQCFVADLLPCPTPYDNFDRKAFDDGNIDLFPIMNKVFTQLFSMEHIRETPVNP